MDSRQIAILIGAAIYVIFFLLSIKGAKEIDKNKDDF